MKVIETKARDGAAAAEVRVSRILGFHPHVELEIRPLGWKRGQGGFRNIPMTALDAKILAYALLTEAEHVEAAERQKKAN